VFSTQDTVKPIPASVGIFFIGLALLALALFGAPKGRPHSPLLLQRFVCSVRTTLCAQRRAFDAFVIPRHTTYTIVMVFVMDRLDS
jgi:hypothetical protein